MAKNVLKRIGRAAYQAKTAPLQAASRLASRVAPGSRADQLLGKAARPFKKGGSVMKYKDGGCVAGAANRRRRMQEMVN
jgi:hypothetical protein